MATTTSSAGLAAAAASSSSKPMSTSCQSIASAGQPSAISSSSNFGGSGIFRSSGAAHYVNGTGSLGRLKYHHKHKNDDASDDELDYAQLSQSTHILGRVKSERFLASKSEEDRRRRTIIVEKKNDSFGFTLQSYGIHYKRDQEVEMITYVDYVEYDGPAYKAGMREGDVILSINGTDMEKADHKTIVDFIKSCETRMRMVVLFEDCVRKVDLHMRYIQLQNMLQSKMNELERICLRERELLEGKWKTHSLPARKKATTSPIDADNGISPVEGEVPYYRPTLSTEDVANIARQQPIIPPPAQFMLTYHYLDPTYRYILKPVTAHSSGEYIVSESQRHSPSEQHYILSHAESGETITASASTQIFSSQQQRSSVAGKPPAPPPRTCEKHRPPSKLQQTKSQPLSLSQSQSQAQSLAQSQQHEREQQQPNSASGTPKANQKSAKHCHGHSCNPCIGHFRWKSAEKAAAANVPSNGGANGNGNGDNVSLDAYDLASPCCDIHCVPTRRRLRHHKEHTHKHKHRDRERESKERPPRPKSQSHISPTTNRHVHHHHHHHTPTAAEQQQQHPHAHAHHHSSATHKQRAHIHQHQHSVPQHACDSHNGSMRSRYFDLASGLASHCSLHSCTSSDFAPDSGSYTTSISTDTLFWDPNSEQTAAAAAAAAASRQHSTKSRQSYQQAQTAQHQQQHQQQQQQQQHHHQQQQHPQHMHHSVYQQRYHITATQVQPTTHIYPNMGYVHKPKSWDNLTTKAIAYGYLDTVTMEPVKFQLSAQQRHSMPRKNPYGRYSTYTDVENYAPPPTEFVEELTTTTTTTITAKSTEELIATCDCIAKQQQQQQQALKAAQYQISQNQKFSHQNNCQLGYYSHLPRPTSDAGTSTAANTADVATVTEITRL